jgi:hypothetical protein
MSEFDLTLSEEERDLLADLLVRTLKAKRVEEHRTRAMTYRDIVLHEEVVLEQILDKLGAMMPDLTES